MLGNKLAGPGSWNVSGSRGHSGGTLASGSGSVKASLGACPTLTVLLRRTIRDHLRRSRPETILNVFVFHEYTSDFFRPAASHLATAPSPRHERQRWTGSEWAQTAGQEAVCATGLIAERIDPATPLRSAVSDRPCG